MHVGALVSIRQFGGRPELIGKIGHVLSLDESDQCSIMVTAETVRVHNDCLQELAVQPLHFSQRIEALKLYPRLLNLHDALSGFWKAHMLEFGLWWQALEPERKRAVLKSAWPYMPAELNFEESLLPECCTEVLLKACGCAKSNEPCEHGAALRLSHEFNAYGTHDLTFMLNYDTRLVYNLHAAGMLQSPTRYGPYGSLVSKDGMSIHQLEVPLSDAGVKATREQVDRDELILAHVIAAAETRRYYISLLLCAIVQVYRSECLGLTDDGSRFDRLAPLPNFTYQEFVRARDRYHAPWHPRSYIVAANDSPQPTETLHEMMARLVLTMDASQTAPIEEDRVARYVHQLFKHGHARSNTCAVCGVEASSACKCESIVYCGKACQKADWKNHKLVCSARVSKPGKHAAASLSEARAADAATSLSTQDGESVSEPVRSAHFGTEGQMAIPHGDGDARCTITPCDCNGTFVLKALFEQASDGSKDLVMLICRVGLGVEMSMSMASSTFSETAKQCPLEQMEQLLYGDGGVMNLHFPSSARISNEVAAAFLARVVNERRVGERDRAAVDAFRQGLENAMVVVGGKDALKEWMRAPVQGNMAVLQYVRDMGQDQTLGTQAMSVMLQKGLLKLEAAAPSDAFKFDLTMEMRRSGLDPESITGISKVLQIMQALDEEASGGVRTRYKHIFEHQAAWLHAAKQQSTFGRRSAQLQENVESLIGFAIYCASVQCASSYMFSSGLFQSCPAPEANSVSYRNQHACCSLLIAMALRWHNEQGRDQVSM